MNTPPHEPMQDFVMNPQNRRTTRAALADIPTQRMGLLRVSPPTPVTPTNVRLIMADFFDDGIQNRTRLRETHLTPTSVNIPESFVSPAPSPDEIVIQQRGRRRMPITWSPDYEYKKSFNQNNAKTPTKTPTKSTIVLRSTPRKRLMMCDSDKIQLTPEKRDIALKSPRKSPSKYSPIIKKAKLDLTSNMGNSVQNSLKALSKDQLILLINDLMGKHPNLEPEIKQCIPLPDLRPVEEKLNSLKRNIFKSLPSSRLSSRTDSAAFSRASTHLQTFKKTVMECGRSLVESQNWDSVLDYCVIAWSYVRSTPTWDNFAHNAIRKGCFKSLSSYALTALKKGTFNEHRKEELLNKMKFMVSDCDDLKCCINLLESRV